MSGKCKKKTRPRWNRKEEKWKGAEFVLSFSQSLANFVCFYFQLNADLRLPNWADINEFIRRNSQSFAQDPCLSSTCASGSPKRPLELSIETPPKIKLICLLLVLHTPVSELRDFAFRKLWLVFSNASSSVTLMQFFQRLANGKQTKDTLYNDGSTTTELRAVYQRTIRQ